AREVEIAGASADFNQTGWTISHALDHNEKTAWGIYPKVGESHQAVFRLKEPLVVSERATLTFILKQLHGEGHLIGRVRLSVTSGSAELATTLPAELDRVMSAPSAPR